MVTLEFHCHTIHSKDSLVEPAKLVETCQRKGIDRVIVTDHNDVAGAKKAQRLDPERVIIGEEIMTSKGELLAAFVKDLVPSGLPPLEAITLLRQQNAFISVSHPFDHSRKGSWDHDDLVMILPYVDAIEIFNSRCFNASANLQAQEFARLHHLVGTVGSDAHTLLELGRSMMKLPDFRNADELRQALSQATIQTRLSSPLIHFTSRWAVWYKEWKRIKISKSDASQDTP